MSLMLFCRLIPGRLMVNLTPSIAQKLCDLVITWWCWKELELLKSIYLVHFRWGKSHTLVPLRLIRLWVKVMTLLNTFSTRTFTNRYLNVWSCLPSPGKNGEAIGKEYSDSISFAAIGFQKQKTWPGPYLPKLGLKTKFPQRLCASKLWRWTDCPVCLCWWMPVVWMQTTE